MMRTLLILRCLDRVAAEARELWGGASSIGRGSESKGVQITPERYFSKRRPHSQAAERSPIRRPILHSSITIHRTPFNPRLRRMARAQSRARRNDSIIVFRVSG
jgi:hypothetical protein